jgi:midasin
MLNSDWIVLENVNFASSSVLDRLNAVIETDRELLINECGVLMVVRPS